MRPKFIKSFDVVFLLFFSSSHATQQTTIPGRHCVTRKRSSDVNRKTPGAVDMKLPTRAESENRLDLRASDDGGGGDADHRVAAAEHQQTAVTHGGEGDGVGSVEQRKEGPPVGKVSNHTDNVTNETNGTLHATTPAVKPMTPPPPTAKPILPVQTGVKAQEEEQSSGLTIFFSLLVIGW
ncbi:Sodium/hydrogen exchanger 8 [Liparis tanakae]|uniref:Sodium/hydrogen exchanger 8 n=1 Tax=Liparis tanakae TaxID=230148 RepID=A0A4Z2EP76_9TELE|nr:Sodium/hydrogen exchanger 8 [Liparis tanakae]